MNSSFLELAPATEFSVCQVFSNTLAYLTSIEITATKAFKHWALALFRIARL